MKAKVLAGKWLVRLVLGAGVVGMPFGESARAGVLYSERDLRAVGELWDRTRKDWKTERDRHKDRIQEIEAGKMTRTQKDFYLHREMALHRAESQRLAWQRHQVQSVLIHESNARAGGGAGASRQGIQATLGTQVTDRGHRGMSGDLDAGGGEITAKHLKAVLKDMGVTDLPIEESPGTLDIGGEFELCIHKGGLAPAVGSEYHGYRDNVDARNHEVYISERMRDRVAETKQAGTDFVEVQDHLKKAMDGLHATDVVLVSESARMQILAKGTGKTLQIGAVSDTELAAILRQNGIADSPAEFRQRLSSIKEQKAFVTDPDLAGKIRNASRDIFNMAEIRTAASAKAELAAKLATADKVREDIRRLEAMTDNPATRARRETLKKSLQSRERALREEIVDSNSKMRATATANAETRARATDAPEGLVGAGGGKKPGSAPPDPSSVAQSKTAAGKAYAVYSAATDLADVVQACKTLEAYVEGEATLGQVVRSALDVPPLSPIGTLVGTAERSASSAVDYMKAQEEMKEANERNLTAHLTDWELAFRRAGVSAAEARSYVEIAVLAGNLDMLEAQAARLSRQGLEIKPPVLVVEDGVGPDGGALYMVHNAKDLIVSGAYGLYDSACYILAAPGRTLTAWGEGELAEAVLEYNSATAESDMHVQLYRRLLNAGIDKKWALQAVQEGGSELNKAMREATANLAEARRQEEASLERVADNERRAEDHRMARKIFGDMWEHTERIEREQEHRVEASYQEWTEHLAGLAPAEREKVMDEAGLTTGERAELETRVAAITPSVAQTPSPRSSERLVPPDAPARTGGDSATLRVVYGESVVIDFGKDFREANRKFLDAMAASSRDFTARLVEEERQKARESEKSMQEGFAESQARLEAQGRALETMQDRAPPPLDPHNLPVTRGGGITHDAPGPVARDPDAGFPGGSPTPPVAVQGPTVRYIYQSSPTVTFEPTVSADGRTRVTFTRMGEVLLWAQVEVTRDGVTTHSKTRVITCNVVAPETAPKITPADESAEKQATIRKRRMQLIEEGYALEKQGNLPGAIGKYTSAEALGEDPRVKTRIEGLELRIANQARAQKLLEQGFALEKQKRIEEALGHYEEAQRLVNNDGVARRITTLRETLARSAEETRKAEAERHAIAARERAAREQALREQAAREKAANERAAREQALREKTAREKAASERAATERAAREKAAREQAAREQRTQAQAARPTLAPALPQVAGTYIHTSREDGETWVHEMQLRQSGNRISGSARVRVGGETLGNQSISGSLQGHHIRFEDGTLATVSPDGRSISVRTDDGTTMVLRKQ